MAKSAKKGTAELELVQEEPSERQLAKSQPGKEDLSKLIASVQADLGGAARIQHLHEVVTPYDIRRPTGVADLDMKLGGGFPAGTLNQVFGPDGSGKDLITNHIIAENQRIHGDKSNVFWMSFGYLPDLPFMRMAGVQIAHTDAELVKMGIDPILATEEQRGKDVGNLLFINLGNASAMENPAEVLLSAVLKLVRSNRFQIGIINELGSGETKDNVEKDLNASARVATWAGLLTSFLQKFYTAMRAPGDELNETTLFMILPVRANLDAYTAKYSPFSQPSGYALKHAKAIDLHVKAGKVERDKDKNILSKDINWKIGKGKLGVMEGAEGTYTFIPGKGIDLLSGLLNTAKSLGLVRQRGPLYTLLDYEDRIGGGLEGVAKLLRENQVLYDELRDRVREQLEAQNG